MATWQKYLIAEDYFNFLSGLWNKLTSLRPSEWDEEVIWMLRSVLVNNRETAVTLNHV